MNISYKIIYSIYVIIKTLIWTNQNLVKSIFFQLEIEEIKQNKMGQQCCSDQF